MGRSFWRGAGERAARTFVQGVVGAFVAGSTIVSIDWQFVLVTATTAAVLSFLMSVLASNFGADGPSFGPEMLTSEVAAENAPDNSPGYVAGEAAQAPEGSPVYVIEKDEVTGGYDTDDKK